MWCPYCYPPLERLADAHEILGRLHARDRIQVVTKINPHRTDRRRITQAEAHVVGVQRSEIVKANVGKNISSVVEDRQSQAVFDGLERNARLSVQDETLVASAGHLDVGAVCRRTRA